MEGSCTKVDGGCIQSVPVAVNQSYCVATSGWSDFDAEW